MDFYLDDYNVIKRLTKTWLEEKKLIIAYDFDDTVYDYYGCGREFTDVITLLQRCEKVGAHFICFTARPEDDYSEIKCYLANAKIPCDYINENIPIMWKTGRKIYYNILLDDKAGLSSAYHCLSVAVGNMNALKGYEVENEK